MRVGREPVFSRWLVLIILCFGAVIGCGRKGAPRPPEESAPRSVLYLTAKGETGALVISWQAPDQTTSGDRLSVFARFIVRRTEGLEGRSGRSIDVGIVKPEDAIAAPAVAGRRGVKQFMFRDTAVQPGRKYDYLVIAENTDEVEGEADSILRVSFAGESSTIETVSPEAEPRR